MAGSAELAPSPPDNAEVPVPPPAVYAAGLLLGALGERVMPLPRPPGFTRALGLMAIAAGAGLIATSGSLFRRRGTSVLPIRPSTALVDTGPYAFTRNPMYLGMACVHAGVALRRRSTWSLFTLAPVVAVIDRVVIAREEPYLERTFGAAYRDYRSRVRRWM